MNIVMDKPVLHLLHPDIKTVEYFLTFFEELYPNRNRYLAITNNEKARENLLKSKYSSYIEVVYENNKDFYSLIGDWHDYRVVITHSISPFEAQLIKEIPLQIKVGWTLFGYEVYNFFPLIRNKILLPKTSAEFLPQGLKSKIVRTITYQHICKFIGKYHLANSMQKALDRVDVFGVTNLKEGQYIINTLGLNCIYKQYFTYDLNTILGNTDITTRCSGQNILLGNSSSLTNNHLEALQLLSKQSLGTRKVITPLSYGSEEYGDKIILYGNRLLGDNFQPLTNFLHKEEYNTILLSCSVAIMNHLRQQALGNIISLLWFGTKVFLNEANPVYQYFSDINVKVFSIQKDLKIDFQAAIISLPEKDVAHNRAILSKIFSKEAVLEKNRQFLEALIQ